MSKVRFYVWLVMQTLLLVSCQKDPFHPENKQELISVIQLLIDQQGDSANLNCINTDRIADMSFLFASPYEVDEKQLDYDFSNFSGDISGWDVSNVKDMFAMFAGAIKFNEDISTWDVSNVTDISKMFWEAKTFNSDISSWNVSNLAHWDNCFYLCPIKKQYIPQRIRE